MLTKLAVQASDAKKIIVGKRVITAKIVKTVILNKYNRFNKNGGTNRK